MNIGGGRLRVAVILDAALEGWTSMDYVGEMLLKSVHREHDTEVDATPIQPYVPQLFGRLPRPVQWLGQNMDRFAARCVFYPAVLAALRNRFDIFHIVDHSYAHAAHVLPPTRTGIYCHDLDALDPLFSKSPHPLYRTLLAQSILSALRKAAIVFYSTDHVRKQIVTNGLLDERKLTYAPYGIASEFTSSGPVDAHVDHALPRGRFFLHVGSGVPRKRLELLFRAFAQVRANEPNTFLVQQGAELTSTQQDLLWELGIARAVVKLPTLSRVALAHLYRRAELVVLPSDQEGFGLPVIEALACGKPVLASDIPAFREVGGSVVSYCDSSEPASWAAAMLGLLRDKRQLASQQDRVAQAARFSWSQHTERILAAYRALA